MILLAWALTSQACASLDWCARNMHRFYDPEGIHVGRTYEQAVAACQEYGTSGTPVLIL